MDYSSRPILSSTDRLIVRSRQGEYASAIDIWITQSGEMISGQQQRQILADWCSILSSSLYTVFLLSRRPWVPEEKVYPPKRKKKKSNKFYDNRTMKSNYRTGSWMEFTLVYLSSLASDDSLKGSAGRPNRDRHYHYRRPIK